MLATLNSIAFHAGALRVDRRMDDPRPLRILGRLHGAVRRLGRRAGLLRWVALARGTVTRALTWESALQEARRQVPGTGLAPGATKALGGREVARQHQHHQADRSSYGHAASASVSRGWLT
jgi:hypothetical protein